MEWCLLGTLWCLRCSWIYSWRWDDGTLYWGKMVVESDRCLCDSKGSWDAKPVSHGELGRSQFRVVSMAAHSENSHSHRFALLATVSAVALPMKLLQGGQHAMLDMLPFALPNTAPDYHFLHADMGCFAYFLSIYIEHIWCVFLGHGETSNLAIFWGTCIVFVK